MEPDIRIDRTLGEWVVEALSEKGRRLVAGLGLASEDSALDRGRANEIVLKARSDGLLTEYRGMEGIMFL